MEKIFIAVGSKRRPKLGAVSDALIACGRFLAADAEFVVVGAEVNSDVSHTPTSCEELMLGARQRSEAVLQMAREEKRPWRYFVGLEGGLEVLHEGPAPNEPAQHAGLRRNGRRRVFLESWAYVTDGERGYFGRSGGLEFPEALAHEVLDKGVELAVAIDKFADASGIRDAQGAWGVLSGNLITRQEAFRVAVIAAFAPFYNAKLYRRARGAA